MPLTVLVITGTGTGVGKTVATAALASAARQAGIDVAVCKPVQTGIGIGDDDLAEVVRLSGVTEVAGLARYPEPLAPVAAAEQAGMRLPSRDDVLSLVRGIDQCGRLTLVEGAGGLLVELADARVTLRDLAADLNAAVLVVATAELGTLNYAALTLEALATQEISCSGLVIGSWPERPGALETSNLRALQQLAPVRAALPAGAALLDKAGFAVVSARAFNPDWVAALAR
jgi:dethiobiotin synthetase